MRNRQTLKAGILACLVPGAGAAANGAEQHQPVAVTGPVVADIVRVIDGDTILVSARPWPQQTVEVYVRLRGIDTPELRSSCPDIRVLAQAAKARLIELASGHNELSLTDIEGDKFFGRVIADVRFPDGVNPAQDLVAAGLASSYHGGKRRQDDCRF
ncbi:thermonuclease family protein [Sinorhizobium sp. BG8]|uniref:thermonuclease family protein n=1 Tax=Sinorhizobium sp. BG8 TaxID=2613773 RepID=UPI00193E5108|nr:thermonuclease family protein [Sinorhizobium sp. BG8]QRM53624.1 thermonuclease family protein [Sinorhizobium sp. BG8]